MLYETGLLNFLAFCPCLITYRSRNCGEYGHAHYAIVFTGVSGHPSVVSVDISAHINWLDNS